MKKSMINNSKEQTIRDELEALGVSKEFIQQKSVDNLYMAKEIVDGYDFGSELTEQERRGLIQAVLNNALLNKNNRCSLYTLMQNLRQAGFEEQDIYGMIINLGVNGKILDERAYAYTDLLRNKNYACQSIAEYRDKIKPAVTPMTILSAIGNELNQEEEELINEIKALGINEHFIELKDVSGIYIAKTIVERYDFGRELTPQEKKTLIQAILDISLLNKSAKRCYLDTLMQRFEQMGFGEQEIYGIIINLGVNGRVLEETGYGYSCLLANKDNARDTIEKHKEKIEKQVSSMTILIARSNNISPQEEKELQEELAGLGMDRRFIAQKDIRNIFMAKAVVEGYNFERELTQEEKRALMYAVLGNFYLNNRLYLSTLMRKFDQMGLEEQETYGAIINLGVNGKILEEASYSYSDLLSDKNNACQNIAQYRGKIETRVSSGTILAAFKAEEKVIKKAEKIMQGAVRRRKGAMKEQPETRKKLGMLTEQEKSQETEQEDNGEVSIL